MEKEGRILKIVRNITLAAAISIPFGMGASKVEADPYYPDPAYARITGYYCQRLVGYPGYDMGGNCGSPAFGGVTITGETAGCGNNWKPYSKLLIEGYPKIITCNDTGGAIAPNQIDIFFESDLELHNANIPSNALVYKIE